MVTSINSSRSATLTVLYDGDCGFCTWTAMVLRRLDRRRRLSLVPLAGSELGDQPPLDDLVESLHAVDAEGRWWVGADACLEIAHRIPILRPLELVGRLPLAKPVLAVGYRVVARNRHRLSRLLGLTSCARNARWRSGERG